MAFVCYNPAGAERVLHKGLVARTTKLPPVLEEKFERIKPVFPSDTIFFYFFEGNTCGITLLTSARRSRFNASSDGTCFGSTLGFDASVYFSGFRPEVRFRPPCLRR